MTVRQKKFTFVTPSFEFQPFPYIHNHIHTVHSFICIRQGFSPFSSMLVRSEEKAPWGAEPGFELGPAIQQASAQPDEPRCTLNEPRWSLFETTTK
jgi:hypothetical protein